MYTQRHTHTHTVMHTHCDAHTHFDAHTVMHTRSDTHPPTQTGSKEEGMAPFRAYLQSRGGELAGNAELASLFALPYVPDPAQHPSFKKLFLVSTACTHRYLPHSPPAVSHASPQYHMPLPSITCLFPVSRASPLPLPSITCLSLASHASPQYRVNKSRT